MPEVDPVLAPFTGSANVLNAPQGGPKGKQGGAMRT
jgi:hypothetical protein